MPKNEYICDCNVIHDEAVAEVNANMPKDGIISHLADFYKIMGDRTRCKLLFALLQREMCVCDLANVMSMSKSSVSHQLAKMRECSLVKCRKNGKTVYYSLDDEHISHIFKIGMEHISHKFR